MIRLLENNNLKVGDVIRFSFPYSAKESTPDKLHYAIVMEPSQPLLDKPFEGNDVLELTHYRANKEGSLVPQKLPYLCKNSFTEEAEHNSNIRNMFLDKWNKPDKDGNMPVNPPLNTYKYSVPHTYRNTITVCSVHPGATLKNFTYIGSLKDSIYKKFKKLYADEIDRCNQLVMDKESNVYELAGPVGERHKYLIDGNGKKVGRETISESISHKPLVLLLLTEQEYYSYMK